LAEHAEAIRGLSRRAMGDIIEIGRHLAECRDILKEDPRWRVWLKDELRSSPQTAGRLIQIYTLSKDVPRLEHLDLPLSAVYLLAAPSTSPETRDEIIERAEAGEKITVAEVEQTIAEIKAEDENALQWKQHATTVTPPHFIHEAEARNGRYVLSPVENFTSGNFSGYVTEYRQTGEKNRHIGQSRSLAKAKALAQTDHDRSTCAPLAVEMQTIDLSEYVEERAQTIIIALTDLAAFSDEIAKSNEIVSAVVELLLHADPASKTLQLVRRGIALVYEIERSLDQHNSTKPN